MKKIAITSLLTFCLFTACSQFVYKTFYNNLDYIVLHQIDGYFDITDAQKKDLSAKISLHHKWHRDIALPKYINIIHVIQNNIKTGYTEETRHAVDDMIRQELNRIAEHLADDATTFLLSLSPEQITHFKKHLAEYDQKIEEEKVKVSPEKRIKDRINSMIDNLEIYYGDFSSDQKKEVSKLIPSIPDIEVQHLEYLKQTQAAFVSLLEEKTDRETLKKFILGWATRDDAFMPANFRKLYQEQRAANLKAILTIDRTIVTPKQKTEGIDKLNDMIDLIKAIMNDN